MHLLPQPLVLAAEPRLMLGEAQYSAITHDLAGAVQLGQRGVERCFRRLAAQPPKQHGAGCSERIGLRGMPLAQRGKQAVAERAEPRRADRNRCGSGAEAVKTWHIGERLDVALRHVPDQRETRQIDNASRIYELLKRIAGVR